MSLNIIRNTFEKRFLMNAVGGNVLPSLLLDMLLVNSVIFTAI